MLKVKIVQTGTIEINPEEGMVDNRPTCSLIQSDAQTGPENVNILIDLDHPVKDPADLVASLGSFGLTPRQIGVVILTHLHPDHIGHKDFFPQALFMYHKDEKMTFYFKKNRICVLEGDVIYLPETGRLPEPAPEVPDLKRLGDRIYIRHCPGHTRGCLVVFVQIYKYVYAFAGDIFLNREYYDRWEPPAMSWDREKIFEHMEFIREHADVIVPGHGAPFKTR